MIYRVTGMVWGAPAEGVRQGEAWGRGHVALALSGGLLVIAGVMMPGSIRQVMNLAVLAVTSAAAR
jgi:hypothetical protein